MSATVYTLVWVPDSLRHRPIRTRSTTSTTSSIVSTRCTSITITSKPRIRTRRSGGSGRWTACRSRTTTGPAKESNRQGAAASTRSPRCRIRSSSGSGYSCVPWVGVAGLARAKQSLRADRRSRICCSGSRGSIAAHYLRLPFLRRHSVDLSCNAIVLQRVWQWAQRAEGIALVGGPRAWAPTWPLAAAAFVFFYPILAAHPISVERLARPHVVPNLDYRPRLDRRQARRMSGHSKWHNIKLKKGKVDAQRGASSPSEQGDHPGRERRLAGSRGQLPPEDGGRESARDQHAAGKHQAGDRARRGPEDDEPRSKRLRYEGYGPHGVAVVVDAATETATAPRGELRFLFSDTAARSARRGSVAWMFDPRGDGRDRSRPADRKTC